MSDASDTRTGPGSRISVLVNLTWLVPGVVGGSEESTTDALRALLEHRPEIAPTLAVLRPFAAAHPDLAEACRCEVLDLDGSNKGARVWAEQRWLARLTRAGGFDVVHHAGGVVPLAHPGKVVLTIHDLQPLDLPGNFGAAKRLYARSMLGRSAATAEIVCVPSEFTAGRVGQRLDVDRARLRVVPWSVRSHREPVITSSSRSTPEPSKPVFLYPAITYAHKNHLELLEAFAGVVSRFPEAELLLPGGPGPLEAAVVERIGHPDLLGRVSRPGRVTAGELEEMYTRSTAVVVPSGYEGFGLPALEAMARGVPVLVSDAGSLPEVLGGSGLAPVVGGPEAWRAAMLHVASLDAADRGQLIEAQRARAALFTPRRTADALADAYRDASSRPEGDGTGSHRDSATDNS